MSFRSGTVSFCRFKVHGDSPSTVDDALLSILKEGRFIEQPFPATNDVEAGFTTGEHLLDTDFTLEKNSFGRFALFALRIDTHKVPGEINKAEKYAQLDAVAAGNPTGFASKTQKREAREAANESLRERAAKGEFRRSKLVDLLWDLERQTIYCSSTADAAIEQVVRHMRQAFCVELDYQSAGVVAGEHLRAKGRTRDLEDIKPSRYTSPPDGLENADQIDTGPALPWIARSVDLKDYLGNEFLLWLWWTCNNQQSVSETSHGSIFAAVANGLDMHCSWDLTGKQTLRGDLPGRMPEAFDALRMGKWPRKIGLVLADSDHQWTIALQGDHYVVSGAALPPDDADQARTPREGIDRRLALTVRLAAVIDALFIDFIDKRTSRSWGSVRRQSISEWIEQSTKAVA